MQKLRPYDKTTDRDAARAVMRADLARDDVGYTVHPGEWDWWCFHRDPTRPAALQLIGDRILVHYEPWNGELSVFGATPAELLDLIAQLDVPIATVGWVSVHDQARTAALASIGFTEHGEPGPVFVRPSRGGVEPVRPVPAGFTIRPLAGEHEAASRSAAARRSFRSDMDPERHVARYLTFMRSPAYESARDVVAVDPSGRVAAFTVHWIDAELSLAQLEPVGTDPDFARLGLGRAVIAATLERIANAGVERVRVTTDGDRAPAIALYRSCGFEIVDRLQWWSRDPRGRIAS